MLNRDSARRAATSSVTFRLLWLSLVLAFTAAAARAQTSTSGMTPAGLAPGSPAGSYALSGFEDVNLFNGNLNFNLPLLRIGGRGSALHTMTVDGGDKLQRGDARI